MRHLVQVIAMRYNGSLEPSCCNNPNPIIPAKRPQLNTMQLGNKWTTHKRRLEELARLHMHGVNKTYQHAHAWEHTMHQGA